MRFLPDRRLVPVLMFHSVGLQNHNWAWSRIAEPVEYFITKLNMLQERGFTTILWDELYAYMKGEISMPADSILLTFDDGYLDNWVYVYPLLKARGMRATIFVSTDFVDEGTSPRPNLEQVWTGELQEGELEIAGFLNWAEMKIMQESGIVDIQSHARTHTWYFSGPRIVDVHRSREVARYPWLLWNANPKRKPYYLNENQQSFVPVGTPIFEYNKSLSVRKFMPDDDATAALRRHLNEIDLDRFLGRHDWQTQLSLWASKRFGCENIPGRYEADVAREARVGDELLGSKSLIESQLSKPVEFLCWPGGANDSLAREMARKAGYKAWTLGEADNPMQKNGPASENLSIHRIPTQNRVYVRGRLCGIGGATFQLLRIRADQQSLFYGVLLKLYKLFCAARNAFRSRDTLGRYT